MLWKRASKLVVTFKCKPCYQELSGFYVLRQLKNTQHRFPNKTANDELDVNFNEVDDMNLKEKLRSSQHFLVDSELERARHKVFSYVMQIRNETVVNEKLEQFFNESICAAKVNLAFGVILKNVEDGMFR